MIKGGILILSKLKTKLFSSSPSSLAASLDINCNTLSVCFKEGRIEDAEKVFEAMPVKRDVEWSIMIHGYAKNGIFTKSMELFTRMRYLSLKPNTFTFVGVLVNVACLRDLLLCQSLHGIIFKSGCYSNLIVNTALLDAYAKSGDVFNSYKLFRHITHPNLVSWSAMISGFLYNGSFADVFMLFNYFQSCGNVPNIPMILSLTQGCVAIQSRILSESMHCLTVKFGFFSSLAVNNAIISMYSSLMDVGAARKLFRSMDWKDVITVTTMMGLLIRLGYVVDAVKLFYQARNIGLSNDSVLLMHLILACGHIGATKMGRSIHARVVINGFQCELRVTNSLISMYSRCGDLDSSRIVFNQTPKKSVVSFTAMILGFVENGQPEQALHLFILAKAQKKYDGDEPILVTTLIAAGQVAHIVFCQQIHSHTIKAGFVRHTSIQNTLISIYSKSGSIKSARNLFEEMGHLRNTVSWNVLINGYGINGSGETAVLLFYEMRRSGEDLDASTYLSVLTACNHSGLVREALEIFSHMVDENQIIPAQDHYGCVADLLVRGGYGSNPSSFGDGIDSYIWKALLNSCLRHGNVNLAEVAAMRLCKEGVIESGQVVLLANLYASVGRFQDAEALRLNMDFKGLNKDRGFSFVTESSYDSG
ncbi:hypothetical protein Leryth_019997 [Lithospermum erythrorhizon]|nr:hypothetical protein Leryth_019997 [Lithospermum erythrorhizon]